MKKTFSLLLFFFSVTAFAQTKYYTTDNKNRLTEFEVNDLLSKQVEKIEKILGKKLYGSLNIEETVTKKDSIITKVKFAIGDKQTETLKNLVPLSEFKNRELPHFVFNTLGGERFSTEQLNGKPTMINFWFTNCAPCIDEMPALNKIAEKYKNEFNFIAITFENNENVRRFLEKHEFNFMHLVGAESFIDKLKIKTYPINLFLDKEGVLKYVAGGIPFEGTDGKELKMGDGKEIIEIIEKLKNSG